MSPLRLNVCQLKKHTMTPPGPASNRHSPLAQMTEAMTPVPEGGDGGAQTQTLGFLARSSFTHSENMAGPLE